MKTAFLLCFVISLTATGQDLNGRRKHFNLEDNLAMEGYDPVSYFSGKPKEGKKEFAVVHNGVTYYFAESANRATFLQNPEKFEPAYGGWCAFAMGETGEKVKVDPETFKIIDNKVYLFYNFWGNNTLEDWNKNEGKLKAAADGHWKKYFKP